MIAKIKPNNHYLIVYKNQKYKVGTVRVFKCTIERGEAVKRMPGYKYMAKIMIDSPNLKGRALRRDDRYRLLDSEGILAFKDITTKVKNPVYVQPWNPAQFPQVHKQQNMNEVIKELIANDFEDMDISISAKSSEFADLLEQSGKTLEELSDEE